MLIFKSDIYENADLKLQALVPENPPGFDPYKFIRSSLDEEMELFSIVGRHPKEYWTEDIRSFFPKASYFSNYKILKQMIHILRDGLEDPSQWYHMNTYHFCLMYDVLNRNAYNYNHDNQEERRKTYPELRGQSMTFDSFVKVYFFNTVFLLDQDKYNGLSAKQKTQLGYTCPCQFGVINGLQPCPEEMQLEKSKDYPYTAYV